MVSKYQFVIYILLSNLLWIIINADERIFETNVIWSKTSETAYRPGWSGNVKVTYDDDPNDKQIDTVEGIVLPVGTTGRPNPPSPYNGYPTGDSVGRDKGHLMALSLGGPDVTFNIVPQTARWQRWEGWAQMEKTIRKYAAFRYGWSTLPHATQVASSLEPLLCKVNYFVGAFSYDDSTGEPGAYLGEMNCDKQFIFTILPNKFAKWEPYHPARWIPDDYILEPVNTYLRIISWVAMGHMRL